MITDYHTKYFAHELSKRYSVANAEKLARTLFIFESHFKDTSSFRSSGINVEIGVWITQTARALHELCQFSAGTHRHTYLLVVIDEFANEM